MDFHILMAVEEYWKKLGYRTVLYYAYFLTPLKKDIKDTASLLKNLVSVDERFPGVIRKLADEGFMDPKDCTLTPAAMDAVRHLIMISLGTDKPALNDVVIKLAQATSQKTLRPLEKQWSDKGSEYLSNLMRRIPDVKTAIDDTTDERGRYVKVYRRENEPALLFWFLKTQRLANTDFNLLFVLRNRANALEKEPWKELRGATPSAVIPVAAAPTYGERIVSTAPECGNRLIGPINLEIIAHQFDLQSRVTPDHYKVLTNYLMPSKGGIVDGIGLGRYFEYYFGIQNERGAA